MNLISALETGIILDLFFSYYYRRGTSHSSTVYSSTTCTATPSTSDSAASAAGSPHSYSPLGNNKDLTKSPEISTTSPESQGTPGLADFMRGVHVYFYNMAATEKKKLARYLITYPFTSLHYLHISYAWNNNEQRCLTTMPTCLSLSHLWWKRW